MIRTLPAATLIVALCATTAAYAQQAQGHAFTPEAQDTARPVAVCELGTVSTIFIDNRSIFDTRDPALSGRLNWAYRLVNALHFRTREDVIRRELLFRPGDCYDPIRLEESERLLRAHDFLSRVDLFALPQPDGSYHVVVDTQDEWSTQLDLHLDFEDGLSFDGGRIRELNLLGTGRTLELVYLRREANRKYGAGYSTPQLLGSRWEFGLVGGRTRAGTFVEQVIGHPFVGEVGRWAALQSYEQRDRFFDYTTHHDGKPLHLLLPVHTTHFDMAALGRRGEIGDHTLFGAALSYQELNYPLGEDGLRIVEGNDYDDDREAGPEWAEPIRQQMNAFESLRFYLLIGQRNVTWVKRRGLDSMRGEQDIRIGSEIDLALGHALPGSRSDHGLFSALNIYHGTEAGGLVSIGRAQLDGRRASGRWEDIFGEIESVSYWTPNADSRHTFMLRIAALGGWRTRTPFQTTLGGDLGVRGYERERYPGGRRVTVTLEDRIDFDGPFRHLLDLGATAFLDIGRVGAGDVPFGTRSGWKASAGLGLRGAFPSGSRTTIRLDIATPIERGASLRDTRFIISVGEPLGLGSPAQELRMEETRELRTSSEIFHFP